MRGDSAGQLFDIRAALAKRDGTDKRKLPLALSSGRTCDAT
jgi:hypothetical protein